jgi:transposase
MEVVAMATRRRPRSGARRRSHPDRFVLKPNGALHPRVRQVGPEHFGIVGVDPAKARSMWMLADFYGHVLIEPTTVAHTRGDLDAMIQTIRRTVTARGIRDLVVALERTGRCHLPIKRAFAAAGIEVRIVHPYTTKQFRQPADPGTKTDQTDVAAIHRAAVMGFGLLEPECEPLWRELRLLARHRCDLVEKRAGLRCQIHDHLQAVMPGFAALFDDVFRSRVAVPIARHVGHAAAIADAGVEGLLAYVKRQRLRYQRRTLERIVAWSHIAASPDPDVDMHHRIWSDLDDDRLEKSRQIHQVEGHVASRLARTPYVLLLSFPGINVVSAANFAGEMGPIAHYATAKAITGRAGLFPSRHQSDEVDHRNGSLVRCANRKLRAAILCIADNLIKCNGYFNARAALWKQAGKDPRDTHVRVADRFCRIAFQMVAGRQVFRHRAAQDRHMILDKLLTFHREHDSPAETMLADLQAATDQIPSRDHVAEAEPLQTLLEKTRTARRRGPQPIGEILPQVLAKLTLGTVQSDAAGG